MRSVRTRRFRQRFNALPAEVQKAAQKQFELWRKNPWHPSLNNKPLPHGYRSVRITADYRAVADHQGDVVVWVWIGPHAEYDQLIQRL